MKMIDIERPNQQKLSELGVDSWSVWEKDVSQFDWIYDEKEVCYILAGRAVVIPKNGESVEFSAGDLVTFRKGLKCVWHIKEPIRKHYQFG